MIKAKNIHFWDKLLVVNFEKTSIVLILVKFWANFVLFVFCLNLTHFEKKTVEILSIFCLILIHFEV